MLKITKAGLKKEMARETDGRLHFLMLEKFWQHGGMAGMAEEMGMVWPSVGTKFKAAAKHFADAVRRLNP